MAPRPAPDVPVSAPVTERPAPVVPGPPVVSRDPNRKVSRTVLFQQATWESLEALARELECSVDYLLNEAARHYLRNRVPTRPEPLRAEAVRLEAARIEEARAAQGRVEAAVQAARATRSEPGVEPAPESEAPGRPLAVTFEGRRWVVTRKLFVIGRNVQWADLPLKDGNVSRKHAQVEWTEGEWFLVDLGSTNGVECNGRRITRHRLAEGDEAVICDHRLRFSFETGEA